MKKFLQKSGQWLVMLIAWFAVSATAMADTETFTLPGDENKAGFTFKGGYNWYGAYWCGEEFTIEAPEGYTMTKVEITDADSWKATNLTVSTGDLSNSYGKHTWTGDVSVLSFYPPSTSNWAPNTIVITYAEDVIENPVYYTVAVVGTEDSNAGVIYKGKTYHANETITAKTELSADDVLPIELSGLVGTVSLEGSVFRVTYVEPAYIEFSLPSEVDDSKEGISISVSNDNMKTYRPNSGLDLYGTSWNFTVSSANYEIEKIEIFEGEGTTMTNLISDPEGCAIDGSKATWTGSSMNVKFAGKSGWNGDYFIKKLRVYLAHPDPVTYTVNFIGDVPAGCKATLDGTDFTSNGSLPDVTRTFTKESLVITASDDYFADVDYKADTHTYTVEFKHWITYNVTVTGHMMGALEYNGNYYGNDGSTSFQSKTVINEEEFKAYKLNGYDGAVSVTQESDYVYNVSVTYTESAPITYSVVFNTVPEGAYAWINGVKYEANGTFQTNLELSSSSLQEVYCPEGYYDNSYYSADDHTFYINYIEYDKFYVVVEGTEDANAGVKYNYISYHNGDVLYTENSFDLINNFDYYVTAIGVSGYNAEVSLVDHTITVTYTEKPVQGAPWEVNVGSIFNDCTVIDNNGDGKKWVMNGDEIYYPYHSSNNADDYFVLTPIRLEAGKTYTATISVHSVNYAEKLEVLYGTENSVSSLTNTAIPVTTISASQSQYQNITGNFSVETSGVYYFALHAVSNADMNQLFAKTFSIKEFNPNSVGVASTYFQTGEVLTIEKSLAFELEAMPSATHSWYDGATDIPDGVELKDDQNNTYTITQFNYWDDETQMSVALENAITAPGHYTLTIPAGTIPCVGNRFNKEIVFEWTILDPYVGHFAMSEAGWATLCVDYAYTLPTGYKAYAVGKVENGIAVLQEDGALVLSELLDGVAAGTPVIIEGPQAADVALCRPAYTPAAPEVNYLMGNPYADAYDYYAASIADQGLGSYDYWNDVWSYGSFGPCQLYQLASEEGKVGFYRQVENGATLNCAAHKAFLVVPAPAAESNARFILPGQDVITGIDAIATEAAENIFNLQGQRVIAPAKGGVYVKNGKKIIVK